MSRKRKHTTINEHSLVGNYKHVSLNSSAQTRPRCAFHPYVANLTLPTKSYRKYCDTEREAAITVDRWLLENGKEPVNILKRKTDEIPESTLQTAVPT